MDLLRTLWRSSGPASPGRPVMALSAQHIFDAWAWRAWGTVPTRRSQRRRVGVLNPRQGPMDGVDKAVIGVIHLCSTPFRILSLECNLTGRVGAMSRPAPRWRRPAQGSRCELLRNRAGVRKARPEFVLRTDPPLPESRTGRGGSVKFRAPLRVGVDPPRAPDAVVFHTGSLKESCRGAAGATIVPKTVLVHTMYQKYIQRYYINRLVN